jgi:hypothetical protein
LLYAQIGDFNSGRFTPDDKPLQTLDFGTDFYALQTFRDGQQILGFAWLYNWASKKALRQSTAVKCLCRAALCSITMELCACSRCYRQKHALDSELTIIRHAKMDCCICLSIGSSRFH